MITVAALLHLAASSLLAADPPPAPSAPAAPAAPIVAPTAKPDSFTAHVEDLAALVEPIVAKEKVPGLAVAFLTRDALEGLGVAGVRERGAAAPIANDDRFHLGSCTKAITATLCATLVTEGKLKWESTVGELLGPAAPDGFKVMNAEWSVVTLEELLQHRGGAPASTSPEVWSAAWNCRDAPQTCRRAFVEQLLAKPLAQARDVYVYSNQGYAIAGRMCEVVARKDWETLVVERVCAPLGITSVGFGSPSKRGPAPLGHRADGNVDDSDNPAAIAPAGLMHMTLTDWARFAALHLRGAPQEGMTLDAESFARLHATPERLETKYALGWIALERSWGGHVFTHSGSNNHWYCVVWLAPDKGFAALAACNQGGDAAARACDQAASAALEWWRKRSEKK